MSSRNELIERGKSLGKKYNVSALKDALRNALAINDNEERLALQYALKCKTGESSGYRFTREIETEKQTKLTV